MHTILKDTITDAKVVAAFDEFDKSGPFLQLIDIVR